jgi:hypothetical protein
MLFPIVAVSMAVSTMVNAVPVHSSDATSRSLSERQSWPDLPYDDPAFIAVHPPGGSNRATLDYRSDYKQVKRLTLYFSHSALEGMSIKWWGGSGGSGDGGSGDGESGGPYGGSGPIAYTRSLNLPLGVTITVDS